MEAKTANPKDATRRLILQYFYDRNDAATSRFGKKGSAVKISDVKRELKEHHGLTQQDVMSNLTYLLDRGWINSIDQKKEIRTRGGTTVPSVVTFYEISANGIEKVEGGSEFEPVERYPGINIQATGGNVITLGDGNIVRVEYQELFQGLSDLKERITESEELDDEAKFEVAVDIETAKDQLAKPQPDREVVEPLWARIEKAANLAGLGQFATHVGVLLGQALG